MSLAALFLAGATPPADADALIAQATAEATTDAVRAVATMNRALVLQQSAAKPEPYAIARTRTVIAMYRAFAGDRAGQIDPMAAGAATLVTLADTPARREEAAVATLTVAQFATTAGRIAEADVRLAEGLALLARPDTRQGADAAEGYDIAADVASRRGNFAEALAHARRAAAVTEAIGGDGAALSRSLGNMAGAMIRLGRPGEAEPLLRRALTEADRADTDARPYLLQALQRLADFYRGTGRATLAEPLLHRALAIAQGLPRGFRYEFPATRALAGLLLDRGDAGAARALTDAGAARSAALLGDGAPEHGAMLILLARTELALGRTAPARSAAERAIAIYAGALKSDDPRQGDALAMLAAVDVAEGDVPGAIAGYRAAIAAMAARAPDDPDRLAETLAMADAMSRDPATAREGWTLARDAADRLTARLTDPAGVVNRDADLAAGDRRLFDRSVAVAWSRSEAGRSGEGRSPQ